MKTLERSVVHSACFSYVHIYNSWSEPLRIICTYEMLRLESFLTASLLSIIHAVPTGWIIFQVKRGAWLFGVCVATLFVVAALTSEKTETVSGASVYVCTVHCVCVVCITVGLRCYI